VEGVVEQGVMGRAVRTAGLLLALVAGASVMVGSSCSVAWCWDDCDCHDDCHDGCHDCGHDDDDCDSCAASSASASGTASPRAPVDWTLRDFALVESFESGAARAAVLLDVRGFSLATKLGPRVSGDAATRHFVERVLQANPLLFELADGAGRLRFDGIDHAPRSVLVRYAQELVSDDGVATPVRDAAITFLLDRRGRLLEVWNTTRHDAATLAPRRTR